eukprot:scaffold42705_cov54-Phaeocystis_antarctica.AAC.5
MKTTSSELPPGSVGARQFTRPPCEPGSRFGGSTATEGTCAATCRSRLTNIRAFPMSSSDCRGPSSIVKPSSNMCTMCLQTMSSACCRDQRVWSSSLKPRTEKLPRSTW